MIVSWLILMRLFNPKQITYFKEEMKFKGGDYKQKTIEHILWYCILVLFLMFSVVPAVLIASNCHKNNMLHIAIAFMFSDIYIFNYAVRKFIFKDGFCNV